MTSEINLKAFSRTEQNGKVKNIRKQGFIPGVIYGPETKNKTLKINRVDLEKAYEQAGEYHLINLQIDDAAPAKVIIKSIQKHPTKERYRHVDFYQVNMNEKIATEIPLDFVGEAKAVKELGGFLVKNADSIEVECLPGDLPEIIEVDLNPLQTFDDYIRLKDIPLSKNVELISDPETVVVYAEAPKTEEQIEKEEEEAAKELEQGEKGMKEKETEEEGKEEEEKKEAEEEKPEGEQK